MCEVPFFSVVMSQRSEDNYTSPANQHFLIKGFSNNLACADVSVSLRHDNSIAQ